MMARMKAGALGELCRRMSMSYNAGIDLRTLLTRESQMGPPGKKRRFGEILSSVDRGETLAAAFRDHDSYFPKMYLEMVDIGEQTGRLGQCWEQLADHYEHLVSIRRTFLAAILWPGIQLGLAIFIVGGLIWVIRAIADVDLLGLGYSANASVGIYFLFIALLLAAIAFPIYGLMRGWFGPLPMAIAYRLPIIGHNLQTFSLSRMAWSIAMANHAGLDARRTMKLALGSAGNAFYGSHLEPVDQALIEGDQIVGALTRTNAYPVDFLDAVTTGETTGMLAESMTNLAEQYRERAEARGKTLAVVAGVIVWLGVGTLLVIVIIRLFMTLYLGPINEALKPI